MLNLVDLSCLRGERRLFRGLTMAVSPGTLLAVSGENGSGKTSLLRMLCGLLPPEQGTILWQGKSIGELRDSYAGQFTYIGHLNGLKDDLTPLENLQFSSRLAGSTTSEGACRDALLGVGLGPQIQRLPTGVLSQGQKRRTALARLWLSIRPLWILDEPFAALDETATRSLTRHLETHVRAGGIIVASTHQEIGVAPEFVQHMRLAG